MLFSIVSFPGRLSSVCIASSITRRETRAILKAIRAGVGWVWDRDSYLDLVYHCIPAIPSCIQVDERDF